MAGDIPKFEELFKIFDPYLTLYGLSEVYLRTKTTTKMFQMSQHLLFFISTTNLVWTTISESIFLVLSAQNIKVEDFVIFSEILACNFCCYMAATKSTALGVLRTKIVVLTDQLRDLYMAENNESERKIINEAIAPAKKLISLYSLTTNSLALVYNTFNLIYGIVLMFLAGNDTIGLPYALYYPFDPAMNIFLYVFLYLMEMYAGFHTGFGIVTFDGFFCLVLTHLSMHFDVLCYNLRQIGIHSDDMTEEECERADVSRVKNIVSRHSSLLEASDTANGIFGLPLLVNITMASILNCALMFSVSICPIAYMIKYFLFMMSSFTQLFMVSYYGNKLKDSSSEIVIAAYECNWCEVGPKVRKSLTIIMNKGLQYASLSAFGFTEISMITFMSVVKVSMSYFTLLKTMYEKILESKEM